MPLDKWLGSISRSKISQLGPNNGPPRQALVLLAEKQDSKGLEASYGAELNQGENDHHLAHAVNVMGSILSATAARMSWGRKTSISNPS